MSTTSRTSPISSPPGQEDQSARLAAAAEVGQVEGTIYRPINEYLDWLYAEFARLNAAVANPDVCLVASYSLSG